MTGARSSLVLLGAVVVLVVGCGDDEMSSTDEATDEISDVVPSTPAATDVTIATAPPSVPGPEPCTSPDQAAQVFHDAWANGDQNAADACATQVAIDTLFGGPTGPAAGEIYQGCQSTEAPTTCAYSYEGGAIIFNIGVSDVSYVVDTVEFIAD